MATLLPPVPPQPLLPLRFPLHGSRLIEASAGTGKTWTIAALYLRLVLGHGQTQAEATAFPGGPLRPEQILVMTFTRAATRELSDRIRARLLEAAQVFRASLAEGALPPADPLLAELLQAYPEAPARQQAAWRLAVAAEAMDDAAIHTIDAWCQRMLREHAFDSGSLFDEELVPDEAQLLTQAAQDHWRQQVYPLDPAGLQAVLGVWKDVPSLVADVRQLVLQPWPASAADGDVADLLAARSRRLDPVLADAAQPAAAQVSAMERWLREALAARPKDWNGNKLRATSVDNWFKALHAWAAQLPETTPLALPELGTGQARLTPSGLADARNTKAPPLDANALPPCFAWWARVVEAYDALPALGPQLRLHAAARVAQRLALLKRQRGQFGFADLQARLATALAGPAGPRLRQRLLQQTPVALIDEFQDTSALQFGLFDHLYRVTPAAQPAPDLLAPPAVPEPATALLLIGDPKQSIYRFRGADIDSYLRTRAATAGRHYVLGTNFRSSAALVQAVNHCFEQADRRCQHGAFDYRQVSRATDALGADATDPLPFVPVAAQGRPEHFKTARGPMPALTLVHDLEPASAEQHRQVFAERCAQQIVQWLNDPEAGFAPDDSAVLQRLRPADIAVLVRSGREAAAVRRALRRRRVASVYLSDRDSVFASDEAADLLHWLRAVAEPLNTRLVRTALATGTVGLSLPELAQLAHDDEAFDARTEQLRQLQHTWLTQGVLPLLRQSLHLLQLPARWLSQPDGERRLTNYLHLAELLQAASRELDGEQALIRWLTEQRDALAQGEQPGGDEPIVRLESDADLVKVVTIHKSKGLEYPVVMLPFATHFMAADRRMTRFVTRPGDDGQARLNLDLSDDDLEWAERERLREDLRLCYVALTRARHALWVGVAALKTGKSDSWLTHRSALGHLLLAPATASAATVLPALQQLAEGCPAIALQALAQIEPSTAALLPRGQPPALQDAPAYAGRFDRHWGVASFSALVRAMHAAPGAAALDPAKGQRPADDEQPMAPTDAGQDDADAPLAAADTAWAPSPPARRSEATPDAAPWHRFERGPLAGNFLHELLEGLAVDRFALPPPQPATDAAAQAEDEPPLDLSPPAQALRRLRRRCERAGRGEQADDLAAWLQTLVHHRLPGPEAALSGLDTVLPEMEFWLPAARLPAAEVDSLCCQHLPLQAQGSRSRPRLPERQLHGLLMGFADLVIEHQGRYWVLDYKSNQLGPDGAAYHADALAAAMAEHRYDVQAAIYLLALHRLLRQRLGPAYQPAQQLGGALYLFMRGLDGPAGGVFAVAPPMPLLDALDQLLSQEHPA